MKKNTQSPKLIDNHAPGWLNEFEEQIASLREKWPDANVFALFDCVFNEQCFTEIKKSRLASRCLYDLSNDPASELQAVAPTLVSLTHATAATWREAVRLTDGYPMLSTITTPESLDELAQRLHPWCIVNADGEPYVFRFPDTRRLPGVIDVLTPQQHGAFFGPAHAWHYRTRSAAWTELPRPESPFPPAEEVRLDAGQFAQLVDDSEADQIIAHFHIHEPTSIGTYHPANVHERIAQGLKRADHYGIEHPDRMNWCRMYMQQPQLERIPEAMPLLAALETRQSSFAEIEESLIELLDNIK